MKRLTLICGPSGIGKSTLAEALSDKVGGVWREADTYFINDDGQYVFDPTQLPMAHQWCQQECREWMEAGCDNVVISNTFTTEWERQPYIDMARQLGYEVVLITLTSPSMGPEMLASQSIHQVPVETIRKQLARMGK